MAIGVRDPLFNEFIIPLIYLSTHNCIFIPYSLQGYTHTSYEIYNQFYIHEFDDYSPYLLELIRKITDIFSKQELGGFKLTIKLCFIKPL